MVIIINLFMNSSTCSQLSIVIPIWSIFTATLQHMILRSGNNKIEYEESNKYEWQSYGR